MPPPRGTFNILEGPGDYDVTTAVHSETYPAISPLNVNLASRAVFIAGASRGLGASIATSYARAGASHIALGARSDLTSTVTSILEAAKAANRPRPTVLPVQLDISNPQSVEKAAELVKSKFGRLDIVVNNAGVLNGMGQKIADSSPDEWWSNYEVNVKGPYLILRSFIPLLLATEDGLKTVSTVASVGALIATDGTSGYQASKWAVMKLADHAMSEYRDQGLVTFNVHPGNIHTTMLDAELPDILKPVFIDTPELTGDAMVYLTSEKRDWLAGRYINLTWDLPELMRKKSEIVEKDLLKVKLTF